MKPAGAAPQTDAPAAPAPRPAPKMFDLPKPAVKPILETSSSERMAYKVDGGVRMIAAFCLFLADPAIQILHRLVARHVVFSPYAVLCLVCLIAGTYIGMVSARRGYSGVLTAGGAGFFAGLLRFVLHYVLVPGGLMAKLKVALPVLGIYCMFTFLGGLLSWALRKFLDIRL